MKSNQVQSDDTKKNGNLPGYPKYPATEDIYANDKVIFNIDPEDVNAANYRNEDDLFPEEELKSNVMGEDLDIPGSELDDDAENIGSEDEENNYYSESDTE